MIYHGFYTSEVVGLGISKPSTVSWGTILQDSQPQLPRGDVIGHGSYGSVSRALDVENGFIFAVKKSTVPTGEFGWGE